MKINNMKWNILLLTAFYFSLLAVAASNAETTTTTTTTTQPDGSTTTTVEETTTTDEAESPSQATDRNLIGPAGVTGTIRRSDRRQDRRAGDPRID